MSQYINLTSDFSNRVKNLMHKFYNASVEENQDLSFLLMVATSAFVIPHETLKKIDNDYFENKNFASLVKYENVMFGYIQKDSIEAFEECNNKYNKNFKSCKSEFLGIIRNSLAHGNILVPANKSTNEIEKIVLISENSTSKHMDDKYKFLEFRIIDFKLFLDRWLEFLEKDML